MVSVKKTFGLISQTILGLAVVDAMVVFGSMLAIMQGQAVQHIPFWDVQIKFIVSILT